MYLSNVLPWVTPRPLPPMFPIMSSYWVPRTFPVSKTSQTKLNPERFEALPKLDIVMECRHLVKVFGGIAALNNLSVTVHKNQVTVLLGHNGAGKTTLMNILTGLLDATSGTVIISGTEIKGGVYRSMGFCPQFDAFFEDLTVSDHIRYFGLLKGLPILTIEKNRMALLKVVHLADKPHALPSELSGGMKRKLSIAIALLTRPKLLILDEPTVGMDPETRRLIWSMVQGLRGATTILLSTHDMEEAETLADRIIVMYQGTVVCWGTPSFLKNACGKDCR
ncbi:hypothetical protein HPB50_027250 [Hyalomma asiaticum]|uniref:Uncharacterized protein n=1 Tax=Hyalomma asiaticum TaxID=266040 RepID=A0ACB7SG75_HYAAI|nr:hypothetical protein HPB50_027250 [Hyalomma asiaticum]